MYSYGVIRLIFLVARAHEAGSRSLLGYYSGAIGDQSRFAKISYLETSLITSFLGHRSHSMVEAHQEVPCLLGRLFAMPDAEITSLQQLH